MIDDVLNFVQITATYSNAVLVAILPHFTDVAQKLNLPIHTPIEQSEIRRYFCDPRAGEIGGWVTLTNGYRFWFDKGHVNLFQSPRSYFNLQNPNSVPKFYGTLRMDKSDALAFARESLRNLGYTNELLYSDELGARAEVQLAGIDGGHVASNTIPYYRIIWHDPDLHHVFYDELAEVEVNADARRIESFALNNKKFSQPNPDVGVVPELRSKQKAQPEYAGGYRLTPVTAAYSNACMNVLMPIFTDFAKKLNLSVSLPITLDRCKNIECWMDKGQPSVQIILDNGDRFMFEHGYVTLYYAADNYYDGGFSGTTKAEQADLYWSQPVSTNEMIQIAREAVQKLGYSENDLHMQGPPDFITKPKNSDASFFTRYEVGWDFVELSSGVSGYRVTLEIDAKSKGVKSIYLNNTNLWREPPKIEVLPKKSAKE